MRPLCKDAGRRREVENRTVGHPRRLQHQLLLDVEDIEYSIAHSKGRLADLMSTVPHESLDCQECQEIPQDIQIHPTCIAECLNPFHVADSRTCKEDSTFPSGLFGTEYFQRNFKELVNMFFASRSYGKVSFLCSTKRRNFYIHSGPKFSWKLEVCSHG